MMTSTSRSSMSVKPRSSRTAMRWVRESRYFSRCEVHSDVGLVVGVVRLGVRNCRPDVRSSGGLLSAILEPEVRRDGDREQHADDDQHDQELDEREAALVPGIDALSEGMHAVLL